MALGNNLKRIKKDSLIPEKKKEKEKATEKSTLKAKLKNAKKPKSKKKARSKKSLSIKPEAKAAPKLKVVPAKSKIKAHKKEALIAVKTKEVKTTPKPIPEKREIKKPTVENKPSMAASLDEKILVGGEGGSTLTVKLIPSRRKTVRKTKMIFEGSLSLLEAGSIKDCLLSTFNDYDLIDIELRNISHLDLIPIQLIKVFISYYPAKKVKVDAELPFDIKIIAERAGFGSLLFKEEAA